MFSEDEILALKRYCQSVIDKPRPILKQPHESRDGFLWCDDWRIIEILKYYFNGHDMYVNDPPPNRLKNNPLWSKEAIIKEAQEIQRSIVSAENIIKFFTGIREAVYGS